MGPCQSETYMLADGVKLGRAGGAADEFGTFTCGGITELFLQLLLGAAVKAGGLPHSKKLGNDDARLFAFELRGCRELAAEEFDEAA